MEGKVTGPTSLVGELWQGQLGLVIEQIKIIPSPRRYVDSARLIEAG